MIFLTPVSIFVSRNGTTKDPALDVFRYNFCVPDFGFPLRALPAVGYNNVAVLTMPFKGSIYIETYVHMLSTFKTSYVYEFAVLLYNSQNIFR